MVSTPKAPDPMATAQAQGAMNRSTAATSQMLNMVNQVTPYGNLNYSQSGNNFLADPQGQTYYRNKVTGAYETNAPMITGAAGPSTTQRIKTGTGVGDYRTVTRGGKASSSLDPNYESVKGYLTPQFTATQTLTPEQLAVKEQTDATSLNLGKLANQQSASLFGLLSQPFKYGKSELEDYVNQLGAKRLDPRFATQAEATRTQLVNSGIRQGTPAYDAAIRQQEEAKNDAYNQLALGANDQAFNQALTTYNNPVNVISGLMSGAQVQQPNFVNTPQTNVAGVDYAGLVSDKYKADSAASQAKMGGLFGLLSAPFSAMKFGSDRRLKRDVVRIGAVGALGRYMFRYIWDTDAAPVKIGYMSDEVRKVAPWAVDQDSFGYDRVDYGALA